jgi:hypothetical protein
MLDEFLTLASTRGHSALLANRRAEAVVARVRSIALLFAIPAGFFFACLAILRDAPHDGLAEGIAAAYSFMPFMLAVGIAAFPLTALESLLLASFAVLTQAWALQAERRPLVSMDALEAARRMPLRSSRRPPPGRRCRGRSRCRTPSPARALLP